MPGGYIYATLSLGDINTGICSSWLGVRRKADDLAMFIVANSNEELHKLYSSPSVIRMIKSRRMRWAGHVVRMEKRGMHVVIDAKARRKETTGMTKTQVVDNIKMDLRDIEWDGVDWTDMAQDRDQWRSFVKTVMNRRVLQNSGKFLSGCTIGGSSRRAQLRE
jgi:hypothetical protein